MEHVMESCGLQVCLDLQSWADLRDKLRRMAMSHEDYQTVVQAAERMQARSEMLYFHRQWHEAEQISAA